MSVFCAAKIRAGIEVVCETQPGSMVNKALQAGDLSILRWAGDAQLSPDGDQVAWVETALDLELDRPVANIMVAPSAGGAPRRFADGPGDSSPRWSPDGRYLAYLSVIDDSPVLHLAPLAGGVPLRVETPGPVSFVSWSASGDSLVLVVTVTKDKPATDDPKVKNAPKVVRGMASRLDGRGYLAGRDQLFIYTVEDRSLRQLTSGDYDHRQPCWSPDGTTIALLLGPYASPRRRLDVHGPLADPDRRWPVAEGRVPGERCCRPVVLARRQTHRVCWGSWICASWWVAIHACW